VSDHCVQAHDEDKHVESEEEPPINQLVVGCLWQGL
jgi:hypothetical protein